MEDIARLYPSHAAPLAHYPPEMTQSRQDVIVANLYSY